MYIKYKKRWENTIKIVLFGTGAAISVADRNDSAIVFNVRDCWYMFDCSAVATQQMVRGHREPTKVGVVFLSHLHYDHIADFAYFIIATWMCDRDTVPTVIGPDLLEEVVVDIRKNYDGPLRLAHDLMRIDL